MSVWLVLDSAGFTVRVYLTEEAARAYVASRPYPLTVQPIEVSY